MLDDIVPAFERLRAQGKLRFLGITAVGDTTALQQVLDSRAFDSAQIVYNMLNPSAAEALPANYPAQDYGRLFDHTQAAGVGGVGIRVLAGGARRDRPNVTRLPVRRQRPIRLGDELRGRYRSCAPPVAAGQGWLRRESDRSRYAVCDLAPRRWARSWSAGRRRSSSRAPSPRSSKARSRKPPSIGCRRCGRLSPANTR